MPAKRLPTPFSRKRFGQHFLEPAWVRKVVEAIDPQPQDQFVEIGPGRGALTRPLLERARRVVAFEIDRDLAAGLRAAAGEPGAITPDTGATDEAGRPLPVGRQRRLTIVEGDFLESAGWLKAQPSGAWRVAGNLPYNVASPILFKLLELYSDDVPLLDATLMLQREVAERLVAGPGGREYGVLSVLVQHTADVGLLLTLPPGAFRPAPKVHSALVRVCFRQPRPSTDDRALFEELVRAVFTRRRKTIGNALAAVRTRPLTADVLARADIDARRRPETLSVAEFVRLANAAALQ
jgi:16S rRNA (adenine1518-N6/adenine1519-N6)-dimethyltransferase